MSHCFEHGTCNHNYVMLNDDVIVLDTLLFFTLNIVMSNPLYPGDGVILEGKSEKVGFILDINNSESVRTLTNLPLLSFYLSICLYFSAKL